MKTHSIFLGAGAAIVCAALIWSLLLRSDKIELKPSAAPEWKPVAEEKWCAMLKSADPGERMKGYNGLRKLWEKEWPAERPPPQYGTAAEPDEFIRAAMEALRAEQDAGVTIVGASTLTLAPPGRVQVSWIEDLLKEVVAKSHTQWVKCECTLAIRNLYWRQGQPPSGATMAMINETLTTCRDPGELYSFLFFIHNMYSDLRPVEKTLEFLMQHYDQKVSKEAKRALDDMNLPITPEDRRDSCRVQTM